MRKRNQITSTGHSREVMNRSKQPKKTKGKQSSLLSAPVVGAISRISATFCGFQVTGLSSAYTQQREGYIKQILTDGTYWHKLLCKTKFALRSNREHTLIKKTNPLYTNVKYINHVRKHTFKCTCKPVTSTTNLTQVTFIEYSTQSS